MEELFEIRGLKQIFRKSLMVFVQLTYGATINRKIRESVYFLFNDEIISSFVKQIKDSIWEEDVTTGEFLLTKRKLDVKNNDEMSQTKSQTKQILIEKIPGSKFIYDFIGFFINDFKEVNKNLSH